jgi:putative transcriptional regulator
MMRGSKTRFFAFVPGVALLLALIATFAPALTEEGGEVPRGRASTYGRYLTGQFLIASPRIGDPRFAETVIYMLNHDAQGALGLVVNRVIGQGPLDKFLKGFGIDAGDRGGTIDLHYGGPVESGRGFVLHTTDYQDANSKPVDGRVAWTVQLDVLKAIAEGKGPQKSLLALGYAGWGPGQLEGELKRGDWLTAPADEDILFGEDQATKWQRATKKAGVPL